MLEVATRILDTERRDRCPYGFDQGLSAAGLGFAYQAFDLAECLLDGVKVRRVGRQVQQLATSPFDELSLTRSPL